MTRVCDPGRSVHIGSEEVAATLLSVAPVQAHPYPQRRARPRHLGEFFLRGPGRTESSRGILEDGGERIARRREDVTGVALHRATNDDVVHLQRR